MKPVETALSTSTSATVDLTAPGLGTPKAALIWSSGATSKETAIDDARMSFGFTDGTNSFVTCCFDQHNVGTTVAKRRATTGSVVMHIDGSSVIGEATAAFITDGVRLTMATGFSSAFLVTALLFGDDGTGDVISDVFVGTGTTGAQLEQTDVTAPGFQPEVFILAHGPEVANDTHEDDAHIGIGVGKRNGTNITGHGASSWFSAHGVETTSSLAQTDASSLNNFLNNSTNVQGELQILNIDSEGFSYRDLDADAATWDFGYICMAGSAFETNLYSDQYGVADGTGDQPRTGVGFQPGCVFQVQGGTTVAGAVDDTSPLGFTIAAFDSTDEFLQNIIVRDNVATSDTSNMAKSKSVFNQNDLTTVNNEATFVSFDADGWTLNYTTAVATNAVLGLGFDSQEPVAPEDEDTLTITTPAGTRDTLLTLPSPPAETTKTQWRITPSGESTFTIQTTSSGTDSANVSSSDLQTLNIWLPPLHSYTLQTRHFVSGSWEAWTTASEFESRGLLNSYEKYLALSGISGVDNV
jgi:hypothetical protein